MKKLLKEIDELVDHLVPFLVILLAVLLILGIAMPLERYEPWPSIADSVIVACFLIELYFKWLHVRNVKKFVKFHWLDIIAVFPFYLLFRLYLFAAGFAQTVEEAQKTLHEVALLRTETVVKQLAEEEKLAREAKLVKELPFIERIMRTIQRGFRLIWARWYAAHGQMLHAHLENNKRKIK